MKKKPTRLKTWNRSLSWCGIRILRESGTWIRAKLDVSAAGAFIEGGLAGVDVTLWVAWQK